MQIQEAIKETMPMVDKANFNMKYSTCIFAAFVLMAVALIYVWSHIHMTKLEYQIATEISAKEKLLEEQRRLKVEMATLKSPQRIEAIAKDKLRMSYPDQDQIIVLKWPEE
jgi:cell division protein FtsL